MVRVAVIGVGSMGRNHARVYHEMSDSDLVLQAFVTAIQHDTPVPVTGGDGLAALSLALSMAESGRAHRVIEISHETD